MAMPLKYLAGLPLAVRIVGMIHGVLFVAFVLALIRVSIVRSWSLRRSLLAFGSSIVPFGTFAFDRSLRREIAGVTRQVALSGRWTIRAGERSRPIEGARPVETGGRRAASARLVEPVVGIDRVAK